jgi:peptidyl-prolyl cis-trans isomerase D
MMNWLRKYQTQVLYTLLLFFLVYIAIGIGSGFFARGSLNDAIAEVDGEKIPLRLFNSHYSRALEDIKPGTVLDENGRKQKRDEALRDLVQGVVFREQAKRYGIAVTDQQVVISLAQVPAFQEKGAFSPQLYARALQYQLKSSPQDFEEEQRQSIAFFKLRWLIQSCVKITDKELEMGYALGGADFVKNWKASHKDKRATPQQMQDDFRSQLWQEKVMWAFNQWFNQLGQHTRVKTHLELLEGIAN